MVVDCQKSVFETAEQACEMLQHNEHPTLAPTCIPLLLLPLTLFIAAQVGNELCGSWPEVHHNVQYVSKTS